MYLSWNIYICTYIYRFKSVLFLDVDKVALDGELYYGYT